MSVWEWSGPVLGQPGPFNLPNWNSDWANSLDLFRDTIFLFDSVSFCFLILRAHVFLPHLHMHSGNSHYQENVTGDLALVCEETRGQRSDVVYQRMKLFLINDSVEGGHLLGFRLGWRWTRLGWLWSISHDFTGWLSVSNAVMSRGPDNYMFDI